MKVLISLLLTLVALNFSHEPSRTSDFTVDVQDLSSLSLGQVDIQKSNVPLCLSEIAYQYNVPIGVEISPKDDLLRDQKITVRLINPTLKDVLNSIVDQNRLYSWTIEDGVVNVFPQDNRDPLLKAVLETRFKSFSVENGTSRFQFKESLRKASEVSNILHAYGVSANREIYQIRDANELGRGFWLKVSNITVKAILNTVIRDSETKYWIVRRDRKRKELLINL